MVKDSKILVAGGTGFIGANLISQLVDKGNSVISISKNISQNCNRIKNVKYLFHDLSEPLDKKESELISDIEYIINCSGYIDHRDSPGIRKNIFNNHFDSVYFLTNLAIDF